MVNIFLCSVLLISFFAYSIESRSHNVIPILNRFPQEKQDELSAKQNIESFESRIINGQRAAEGQFPFQALLKCDKSRLDFFGGTLISSTWVITHALYLQDALGCHLFFGSVDSNIEREVRYAWGWIIHPLFNPESSWDHDIALVELNAPVQLTPANLPLRSSTSQSYEGVNMVVTGFGGDRTAPSQFLMFSIVTGLPLSSCVLPSTNWLCAGSIGNSEVEPGDYGGPLLHNLNTLVGIIAWGGDGFVDLVRVDRYLDWIASHTGIQIN